MSRHLVVAVCVLAAVVRIAAFTATDRFQHPEVWESEDIATHLVEGGGFTYVTLGTVYHSYMEPLYPALCAFVYRLTNHRFWVMGIVQVLLGTTLVWLVIVCGRAVAPPGVALLAGLLAALDPGLVIYTTKFHPFVLDTAMWFAAFAAALSFDPRRPWRSTLLTGALIGVCVLTRPTILACLPMIVWWMWTRATDASAARVLRAAALVACIGVIVAPWVWRNYQVQHRLILTRSGSAFVFWLGNNPYEFTGSALMPNGAPLIYAVPAAVRTELSRRDEMGQQDYFSDEATAFVRAQPMAFVKRWALKFGYFWWFSPQAGLFYPAAAFRAFQVFYAALLGLALFGGWTAWRQSAFDVDRRGAIILISGCCLAISVLQSLYYVEGRHRLALEPFLLIFASVGLMAAARRRWPA